jgi:hypothetical protein
VSFGYLTQALASSAFLKNSDPIDFEWPPADMSSLQPGAAHWLVSTGQLRTIRICGEVRFDSKEVGQLIETYNQIAKRKEENVH